MVLKICPIAVLAAACAFADGAREPGLNRDGKVFVHPGITYTQGDIDRAAAMAAAGREPWRTVFAALKSGQYSNPSQFVHGRGTSISEGGFNNSVGYDGRCAHDLALLWRLTGDERYAATARRILVANSNWQSASGSGTYALDNGKVFLLIEAAELLRDYPKWTREEQAKFGSVLRNVFYNKIYVGDRGRWGNQGLTGFRALLAMAIYLDDVKMYDRVWNYLVGRAHRPDDSPYPKGPAWIPDWPADYGSCCISRTSLDRLSYGSNEDWGYDELLQYYIYPNGQCEESCRDQNHTMYGLLVYVAIAEIFWNQGDDLYGQLDNRILTGLEWSLRYNLSDWEPSGYTNDESAVTFENGLFLKKTTRSARWSSLLPSPSGRGPRGGGSGPFTHAFMHYSVRAGVDEGRYQWLKKQWDAIHGNGGYESWGSSGHFYEWAGWGTLKCRTPLMRGDPGFWRGGVRVPGIHRVPGVVKASDCDYYPEGLASRTAAHAVEGRWSSGDWALYTVSTDGGERFLNAVMAYESDDEAQVAFSFDDAPETVVTLPATGGKRTVAQLGGLSVPAGASVMRFSVAKCGSRFVPVAFGIGSSVVAGEISAVPGTDFKGNTVRVSVSDLMPSEDDEVSATLEIGGTFIEGVLDRANGVVAFSVDGSLAKPGETASARLSVSVGGMTYARSVRLVQGRLADSEIWFDENSSALGATGEWSPSPSMHADRLLVDGETRFAPSERMQDNSVAELEMTVHLGVSESASFMDGSKAAVAVVRVDGIPRYVFATGDGCVTNTEVEAVRSGMAKLRVTADFRSGTVLYHIDGDEFGPYPMRTDGGRLSLACMKGLGYVSDFRGRYGVESVDSNVASVGGVEYETLDAAMSSDAGNVSLLWDASLTPTSGVVRTFEANGHSIVIQGDCTYRTFDNGNGTLTLTVLGEGDRPSAESIVCSGEILDIGVANSRAGFSYAIATAPSLNGRFEVDDLTWVECVDASTNMVISSVRPDSPSMFFKVVAR